MFQIFTYPLLLNTEHGLRQCTLLWHGNGKRQWQKAMAKVVCSVLARS